MLKIETYGNFKPLGKQKKKKQIILCHTSREVDEYLTSLNFRYNGRYNRIPNFIITKKGSILQLLSETAHSEFFQDDLINKNSIIISLENLGWLEKKPLTNEYINWNGSIYNGEVFEKKWRDFFFWEPYKNSQYESLASLCKQLTEIFHIEKKCIGHNTKVEGIQNYGGIITRSNLNTYYTDLNPSFNFENFVKKIEYEQFTQ